MITIGIDASRANKEEKTGVEWYAFFVIEHLKKIDTSEHVRFILYSDTPLKGELSDLPRNWESKVLTWPPKRLWTQVRLSFEMLFSAPDVLFIPAHVFPIIHPKKTVMVVHDIAASVFEESYNFFERWYSLFSARRAVKKLFKVIVPSGFTKSELEREFGVADNVSVIPHGVDTRYRVLDSSDEVLKKYTISHPFFLSVGRLETKKNTERIIQAFDIFCEKAHTPHQLLLVGKPGHGYEHVRKTFAQSKNRNLIITPGWSSPDDLVHLMNKAQALIFPSLYEGFGLPILEAFLCETPVITSQTGASAEIARGYAHVVDPLKSDDIAQAMKILTESKQDLLEAAAYARSFSWERCAKETLRLLLSEH